MDFSCAEIEPDIAKRVHADEGFRYPGRLQDRTARQGGSVRQRWAKVIGAIAQLPALP
jgi:hypothetical protein